LELEAAAKLGYSSAGVLLLRWDLMLIRFALIPDLWT
jgi:hypothetical protein